MPDRYDTAGNPEDEYYLGTSAFANLKGIRDPEELLQRETKLQVAARLLIYRAAQLGDLGGPEALVAILDCKADGADTSVWVVNEAMTLCGGIAYRGNDHLARMLRDARASHVMSPTTDMLKTWAGAPCSACRCCDTK